MINVTPRARPVYAVPVRAERAIDRPCEILGTLDFTTGASTAAEGFEQLGARAAAIGADAVVAAHFDRGGEGESSRVTGVAVRWTTP